MALQENSTFHNRYRLVTKIGAGGYSQVWLAEDTKAGNLQVALKVFAPGQGLDTQGVSIFSKEYSIVFNLNHGNLLKPMHFDECNGSPYLVLPYCPNGSVFSMIGQTDEYTLAHFTQQACAALEYLHRQEPPIVHQDIKPDNFLLDNEGNFLLTDFGISSNIRKTLTKSMGNAQQSAGTTAYMAPERFSKNLDERKPIKANDIFSLGVTLFELLTGELPYGELGGILANTGTEPADLPSNFAPELGHLLYVCMHPQAHNRPTATELRESAQHFTQKGVWQIPERLRQVATPQPTPAGSGSGRSTQQMPSSGGQGTQKMQGGGRGTQPIPGGGTPSEPQPRPKKSRRWVAWLVSVLVLAIATIAVWDYADRQAEQASIRAMEDQREKEQLAQQKADSDAWALALERNTKAAFEKYLLDFPRGTNAGRARGKIIEIEDAERKAEEQRRQQEADRRAAEERQRQQQTSGTFRDSRDGKTYKWVKIGQQVWMAENLAYKPTSGNYWAYDNNSSNVAKYGYLYCWRTARNVCPTDWHLPSDDEWNKLISFVGNNPGNKLKANNSWENKGNGTDEFGFSALPGGHRYGDGIFSNIGNYGHWWSSTQGSSTTGRNYFIYYSSGVTKLNGIKSNGYSVRCIKD